MKLLVDLKDLVGTQVDPSLGHRRRFPTTSLHARLDYGIVETKGSCDELFQELGPEIQGGDSELLLILTSHGSSCYDVGADDIKLSLAFECLSV